MVGCHLLILCESDAVVAHEQLHVGLAESLVGGLDARLTYGVDIYEHGYHYYCDSYASIHQCLGIVLHLFAEAGEGVVDLVDRGTCFFFVNLICHCVLNFFFGGKMGAARTDGHSKVQI